MSDSALKIFSYLPNPRVWKSLIAAEYAEVKVEVVGDKPPALANWLWDFDARPLEEAERTAENPNARTSRRGFSGTLFKTDAFLAAHPYGTVPAAFSPDGTVGIFESNSILRATVRASSIDHGLYGRDAYTASRIDSFLDAGLVFAREAQVYLLAVGSMSAELHGRMAAAYEFYLNGIENALGQSEYLAGSELTIADIAFVCDTGQFLRERTSAEALLEKALLPVSENFEEEYPRSHQHLVNLAKRQAFARHLGGLLRVLKGETT
jgi:elongation factor 1-gamma